MFGMEVTLICEGYCFGFETIFFFGCPVGCFPVAVTFCTARAFAFPIN
jgi:hypothetical protein